jgi:hypothetical protein
MEKQYTQFNIDLSQASQTKTQITAPANNESGAEQK